MNDEWRAKRFPERHQYTYSKQRQRFTWTQAALDRGKKMLDAEVLAHRADLLAATTRLEDPAERQRVLLEAARAEQAEAEKEGQAWEDERDRLSDLGRTPDAPRDTWIAEKAARDNADEWAGIAAKAAAFALAIEKEVPPALLAYAPSDRAARRLEAKEERAAQRAPAKAAAVRAIEEGAAPIPDTHGTAILLPAQPLSVLAKDTTISAIRFAEPETEVTVSRPKIAEAIKRTAPLPNPRYEIDGPAGDPRFSVRWGSEGGRRGGLDLRPDANTDDPGVVTVQLPDVPERRAAEEAHRVKLEAEAEERKAQAKHEKTEREARFRERQAEAEKQREAEAEKRRAFEAQQAEDRKTFDRFAPPEPPQVRAEPAPAGPSPANALIERLRAEDDAKRETKEAADDAAVALVASEGGSPDPGTIYYVSNEWDRGNTHLQRAIRALSFVELRRLFPRVPSGSTYLREGVEKALIARFAEELDAFRRAEGETAAALAKDLRAAMEAHAFLTIDGPTLRRVIYEAKEHAPPAKEPAKSTEPAEQSKPAWQQRQDEKRERAKERARTLYLENYGEPPTAAEFSPSATAWIDRHEKIGCQCHTQRADQCDGAFDTHDGRCSCGCHEDERERERPEEPEEPAILAALAETPDPELEAEATSAEAEPEEVQVPATGRADYEARKAIRIERLETAGKRLIAEADQLWRRQRELGDVIPMGQPILVGHHSEKRDRRFRARLSEMASKSVQLRRLGERYTEAAERLKKSRAISSDDPKATEKIEDKLRTLHRDQERMKAINAALRSAERHFKPEIEKLFRAGHGAQAAELRDRWADAALEQARPHLAALEMDETKFRRLLHAGTEPDFAGRFGVPAFNLTNNAANIRRLEERAGQIKETASHAGETSKIGDAEIRREENRVRVVFPSRVSRTAYDAFRSHGFVSAPNTAKALGAGAVFQRKDSEQALYWARKIANDIAAETAPTKPAITAPAIPLPTRPTALDQFATSSDFVEIRKPRGPRRDVLPTHYAWNQEDTACGTKIAARLPYTTEIETFLSLPDSQRCPGCSAFIEENRAKNLREVAELEAQRPPAIQTGRTAADLAEAEKRARIARMIAEDEAAEGRRLAALAEAHEQESKPEPVIVDFTQPRPLSTAAVAAGWGSRDEAGDLDAAPHVPTWVAAVQQEPRHDEPTHAEEQPEPEPEPEPRRARGRLPRPSLHGSLPDDLAAVIPEIRDAALADDLITEDFARGHMTERETAIDLLDGIWKSLDSLEPRTARQHAAREAWFDRLESVASRMQ